MTMLVGMAVTVYIGCQEMFEISAIDPNNILAQRLVFSPARNMLYNKRSKGTVIEPYLTCILAPFSPVYYFWFYTE